MERTTTIPRPCEGPHEERPGAVLCSAWLGCVPSNSDKAPDVESEGAGGVRKFEAEGVTLFCADSRTLEWNADALVSDPPYGMEWEGNQRFSGGQTRRGKGTRHKMIEGDKEPFDPTPWLWPKKPVVLWGANHFWGRLPSAAALVWQKRNEGALGTFLSDGELAFLSVGCGVYIFPKTFAGSSRAVEGGVGAYDGSLHPNQKPIALMWWSMERAKIPVGATVADPFMGSGTTAIACIRSGRKFVGADSDPVHFDTAVARVQRELSQRELFAGGGGGFSSAKPSSAEKQPNEKGQR